jgi:hypothetical protein
LACEWRKRNSQNIDVDHPFYFILNNETNLYINIEKHDLSKYANEEYLAYRKFFYPTNETERSNDEFQKAWQHHWQYWCDLQEDGTFKLNSNIDETEYKLFCIEEICDWYSMSRMKSTRVCKYYEENIKNMVHAEFAQPFIQSLINIASENNLDVSHRDRQEYLELEN